MHNSRGGESSAGSRACPTCGRTDAHVSVPGGVVDEHVLGHMLKHMVAIAQRYGRHVGMLHLHADGLAAWRGEGSVRVEAAQRHVARRLRKCVRDSDVIAQLGPETFAVALGDLWEPEMIARVAFRVVKAFARPLTVGPVAHPIPVRIGIAVLPRDTANDAELVDVAAAAGSRMRPGEPGLAFHDAELAAFALRQHDVEAGLELPEPDLFELHYQPIFSVATGQPVGAEALVRWNRPGREQATAGDFIDLAERTGRIASLDRWAIATAATQVSAWHADGWNGWISVNLSGRTLDTPALAEHVATAIERAGANPRQLLFEVTESAAMKDRAASMRTLDELRALGVHVAVDDFGVGHASFSYLRDFNPDLVKLDRSFLHEVETDPRNHRLMEGLILMSHHLGKPVVAEGCEREGQMQWLSDSGCDLVQGYHTGRPIDAAAFHGRWVARGPEAAPGGMPIAT